MRLIWNISTDYILFAPALNFHSASPSLRTSLFFLPLLLPSQFLLLVLFLFEFLAFLLPQFAFFLLLLLEPQLFLLFPLSFLFLLLFQLQAFLLALQPFLFLFRFVLFILCHLFSSFMPAISRTSTLPPPSIVRGSISLVLLRPL